MDRDHHLRIYVIADINYFVKANPIRIGGREREIMREKLLSLLRFVLPEADYLYESGNFTCVHWDTLSWCMSGSAQGGRGYRTATSGLRSAIGPRA